MRPPASNNRYKYSQLLVVAGVSPANPNHSCKHCQLARSHLINRNGDVLVGCDRRARRTGRTASRTCGIPTIYEIASRDWKKSAGKFGRDTPRVFLAKKPADARLCLAIIA